MRRRSGRDGETAGEWGSVGTIGLLGCVPLPVGPGLDTFVLLRREVPRRASPTQICILNGAPLRVTGLSSLQRLNVAREALLCRTQSLVVVLALHEGWPVGATSVGRIEQLHAIVLPEAHFADIVRPRWLRQSPVSTTGAGETLVAHVYLTNWRSVATRCWAAPLLCAADSCAVTTARRDDPSSMSAAKSGILPDSSQSSQRYSRPCFGMPTRDHSRIFRFARSGTIHQRESRLAVRGGARVRHSRNGSKRRSQAEDSRPTVSRPRRARA